MFSAQTFLCISTRIGECAIANLSLTDIKGIPVLSPSPPGEAEVVEKVVVVVAEEEGTADLHYAIRKSRIQSSPARLVED